MSTREPTPIPRQPVGIPPVARPEPLDPRKEIGRLSDRSPFVLLPVRIETRFVNAESGARFFKAAGSDLPGHQLWVRIYPDDCSIDTFEAALSDVEVANAKLYWQGIWSAGGIEAQERAAWRSLVAAHGAGRAGYIRENYQPLNLSERPTKIAEADEILVIPTQAAAVEPEAAALLAYWKAIWQAGEDAAARQAATDTLSAALGASRAEEAVGQYAPYNLADEPVAPATKASVACAVAFVVFPPDPPAKQWSWSQAPEAKQLPERFVVLGYNGEAQTLEALGGPVQTPLYVGPDPSAAAQEGIHAEGEELMIPQDLLWMVDFQAAVQAGMGIAIDLSEEQARTGFDRLLVFGVQLGPSDLEGRAGLEELLRHHHVGLDGLEILAQGTPTHNTTGISSGYGRGDNSDAEASFEDIREAPLFTPEADPLSRRDGQWVAEALGIDPSVLQGVHGAGGEDQLRARAMQRALWPATAGYWMDKMLAPMFGDQMVAQARAFFTEHVSGRGAVPALRIGGQPYGILPTTAFSRIAWLREPREPVTAAAPGETQAFMAGLLRVLREIDGDWKEMAEGAGYVGKAGDAQQTLLDVVGLQSGSVEYRWRYSESLQELFNVINLGGHGTQFWKALNDLELQGSGEELLARLGWSGAMPQIIDHAFLSEAGVIESLIDDRPLSETEPIRSYTEDGRNYITWLIDAAQSSLDALREEQGFSGERSPQMLLYLYLRQALLLGYYDTSYELHRSAGVLSAAELAAMKPEPTFIHVEATATASESRYAALYKTEPGITHAPTLLVSDYITAQLGKIPEAAGLVEQLQALSRLAQAPTAQLERLFAEHIDTCSYRFDAWQLALVSVQLQEMRGEAGGQGQGGQSGQPQSGAYLGAYAWVEDLRPSQTQLQAVQAPSEVAGSFAGSQLMRDPDNGGYVLAPSLTHARTAAVLRSGYLANATPENPETLSVNLSSDRVRTALTLLEGIRNGQSLGALLGYEFERGLHDDYELAEVDKFILPLRKAFPLVADSLASTATGPDVPIEAIEASNVLDGRKLATRIRESADANYPFGLASLPAASATEAAAIDAQANALLDAYDAVADVALAEGVHQAAQGNFERVAATLDAYSSGTFPPEPEVVQTPTPGTGLTHRVALQLEPQAPAAGASPRASAEPALDAWLAGMLHDLGEVGCTVAWTDPAGKASSLGVTLADLALHPLDVLELVQPNDRQAMSELDDRILRYVFATAKPRPDAALEIRYREGPAGKFSIFAASALVQSLRTLVQGARPLRPTDALTPGEATPGHDQALSAKRSRVAAPKERLDTLCGELQAFLAALEALLGEPTVNEAELVASVDARIEECVELLASAASFGLDQAGWGFAYQWRGETVGELLGELAALCSFWEGRLAEFDAAITAYDALALATEASVRFADLQAAEALITLQPEPLPAEPSILRKSLEGKRTELAALLTSYKAVVEGAYETFKEALAAVHALPAVGTFAGEPVQPAPFEARAVDISTQIVAVVKGVLETGGERRDATQAQLEAHDAATSAAAQVQALQAGAKALLGESFTLIPEFTPSTAQGTAWGQAVTAYEGGEPLKYLTETAKIERPLKEWLCGAARVRAPLRAWEASCALAEVFGGGEPQMLPIQLPYVAGEPWLAMQFPEELPSGEKLPPSGERLLYTAHYATPFVAGAPQCGLLLDEWTEAIPATSKEAGLTFNFDRPDSEAPQAILLVTPASAGGQWQWEDLVGALNETLDLAKKRALEPAQIEPTPYARLLPATIMAVTLYGISITTALAVVDDVLDQREVRSRA
jgi:hypothetical protein